MTSNGHAWPIQNFMTFESNRNGRFESTSRSFALQVLRYIFYGFFCLSVQCTGEMRLVQGLKLEVHHTTAEMVRNWTSRNGPTVRYLSGTTQTSRVHFLADCMMLFDVICSREVNKC